MWNETLLLGMGGVAAGFAAATGVFALLIALGMVSDLTVKTHTGKCICLYEDAIVLGAIFGNIFDLFQLRVPVGRAGLAIGGLLAGLFVGCWAAALEEVLRVFPILIRRVKLAGYEGWLVAVLAVGKLAGNLWYFFGKGS